MVDKEEGVKDVTSQLLFICTKLVLMYLEKKHDFINFTCILLPLFLLIVQIYGKWVVLPSSLPFQTSATSVGLYWFIRV